MKKFITEISEEDFKKLNLIGYDNERLELDNGSYTFEFIKKNLNDRLEEHKKYLAELILKDKMNLPWIMTVCIHTEPTEESVIDELNSGRTSVYDEAYKSCLYEYSYLDKWMDRAGHTTYEFGVGLDHLYSTRDKWQAQGWVDYFEVRKKDTKAAYIIHLGGAPEDYYVNSENN